MSKKQPRRVYLGTTRRQKNTRLRTFCITAVLLVLVVVASAYFVSWMLEGKVALPTGGDPADCESVSDGGGQGAAQTDTVNTSPTTETDADESDSASTESAPEKQTVTVTGTPYKVLDYTEKWVVMLDAGHGFDDIGTSSALLGETNEATVNLDITLRAAQLLEDAGVTVLLTHDTNAVSGRVSVSEGGEMPLNNLVLLTPEDRAALANGQDVDMYVSIHCDSIPEKPDVSGMRMYYCGAETDVLTGKRNAGAEALASNIAASFYGVMGAESVLPMVKNLTEEQAYYVIREVTVPSVLCEVGFVTNETDAAAMLDAEWRQDAARGIAEGILAYIGAADGAVTE